MKVHGVEIPAHVERAMVDRMQKEPFRSCDLAEIVRAAEIYRGNARLSVLKFVDRVANNLIQRERRKNHLKTTRYPFWQWAEAVRP